MVPDTKAIACTLTNEEQKARRNEIRSKLLPAVQSSYSLGGHHVITLKNTVSNKELCAEFITNEKRCCGFLVFELSETPNLLEMKISGPDGSEQIIQEMFSLPSPSNDTFKKGCGCSSSDRLNKPKSNLLSLFGVLGACGLACSLPFLLGAIGLIGASSAAVLFNAVEVSIVLALCGGLGYYVWRKIKLNNN